MKRLLAVALLAALLLSACAPPAEEPSPDDFDLSSAANSGWGSGGNAIRAGSCRIEGSGSMTVVALAERLMKELLKPPEEAGLCSPFPEGTELTELRVAGGRATVDLTEQYASLSGIELSLADYCITLTLTQLKGVNAVRITANGRDIPYRNTQLLTAADALLAGVEDVPRPIDVSLFFLNSETGELEAQQQSLALYEGQSRFSAVLDALLRGPEGDDRLSALLSRDFSVLSSRTEDGVCYVNMSSNAALPEDEGVRALALESLERSLLSLSGVEEVQFLIDGEAMPVLTEPAMAEEEPNEA
ncbi:MAG: GerMN domain-containing protein [Oscillospiraceae bacterium]|nr:GerMN domain-containing protein [Oscillospiraceae bacterium]